MRILKRLLNGIYYQFITLAVIATLSLGVIQSSRAENMNVTIKGVVTAPVCTVNDNKDIDMDFGDDLIVTKIDGVNYAKQINYSISCSKSSNNHLKIAIEGAGTDFNSKVLQSTKAGLGIKFTQNNLEMPINNWVNFTNGNAPILKAIPVRDSSFKLTGGEFTAVATLKVEYQ